MWIFASTTSREKGQKATTDTKAEGAKRAVARGTEHEKNERRLQHSQRNGTHITCEMEGTARAETHRHVCCKDPCGEEPLRWFLHVKSQKPRRPCSQTRPKRTPTTPATHPAYLLGQCREDTSEQCWSVSTRFKETVLDAVSVAPSKTLSKENCHVRQSTVKKHAACIASLPNELLCSTSQKSASSGKED